MEITSSDDLRVHRGIKILQGKDVVKQLQTPASTGSGSKWRSASPRRGSKQRRLSPSEGAEGLDLARRRILVVKPGEDDEVGGGSETLQGKKRRGRAASVDAGFNKVIVFDHGGQQREAVRRLFEAQVLVHSFDEQLREKDHEIADLQKRVIRAERLGMNTLELERQDLVQRTSQVKEANKVKERVPSKTGAAALNHSELLTRKVPFWLRNDEALRVSVDSMRQTIVREYMSDGHLDPASVLEHLWQLAYAAVLRWGTEPDEEIVKQNEMIEAKLRRVQRDALQETSMLRQSTKALEKKYKELMHRSREAIDKLKTDLKKHKQVLRELTAERAEQAMDAEAQFQYQQYLQQQQQQQQPQPQQSGAGIASQGPESFVGQRRGGHVVRNDEAMQQANEAAWAAILTQHHKDTSASSSSNRASIEAPNHQAGRGVAHPGGLPRSSTVAGSQNIAGFSRSSAESYPGQGPQGLRVGAATGAAGTSSVPMGSDGFSNPGGQTPSAFAAAASLLAVPASEPLFAATLSGQSFFGGSLGSNASPGSSTRIVEDSLDDINIDDMDLEEMDHELFEPLNIFDDDLRELMISTVNEKVRRILSMDPNKFKNGKLPFGLRPDKLDPTTYDRVRYLESEVDGLKLELEEVRAQLEDAENKVDAQRMRMEGMKAKRAQDSMRRESASKTDMGGTATSLGGGASKTIKDVRFAAPEADNDDTASQEDLIAELNEHVAGLEAALQAKDLELAALRKELATANKRKLLPREEQAPATPQSEPTQPTVPHSRSGAPHTEGRGTQAPSPTSQAQQPRAIETHSNPLVPEVQATVAVVKKQEDILKKVLSWMSKKADVASPKAQQAEKKLARIMHARTETSSAAELEKSVPIFEEWAGEIMKAASDTPAPTPAFEAQPGAKKRPSKVTAEKPKTGSIDAACGMQGIDDEDADLVAARSEVKGLREKCTSQKEEISRLLLTIDELRIRLDKVCGLAGDEGAEVREQVASVMAAAGLQDIMEANSGPRLRAVFERLYQDAVQRMQRLRLILERRIVANKAYSAARNAPVKQVEGGGGGANGLVEPDLARFSDTAAATLKGMFYHYEHLFKRVSEYAEAQGLEDSSVGGLKWSVSDLLEAGRASEEYSHAQLLESKNQAQKPPKSGTDRASAARPRLGSDLGKPLRGSMPAMPDPPEKGNAFWNLPGGSNARPRSPHKVRTEQLADPPPTSFAAYVAALREARGDLRPEEWPRIGREAGLGKGKADGLMIKSPKTIAALTAGDRGAGLNACRSLPALPVTKDRTPLHSGAEVIRSPKGHDNACMI